MEKNRIFQILLLSISVLILNPLHLVIHSNEIQLINDTSLVFSAVDQDHITFLPLTLNYNPSPNIVGIQIVNPTMGFDEIAQTNTSWLREFAILWTDIEPTKGAPRDWSSLANLETRIIQANQEKMKIIMIIFGTPEWAQKTPGAYCGPIKQEELDTFANFVYDVVNRYSKHPYNIKYWEIWNEPDVGYFGQPETEPFGCWGDTNDDYYGGGYFAELLKVVYPSIKSVDADAKVIIGGLLLDCDPRPRPDGSYCAQLNPPHDERPPKFFEGILMNGGENYFDGVTFHAYDYYQYWTHELGKYENQGWQSYSNTYGPATIVKANYIKELLAKYNISGKFLMNTEAALICRSASDPPGSPGCESDDTSLYEQTKARYITQVYAAALADQLEANIWYSLFGWRNSALLNYDLTPRPAYYSYQVASIKLAGYNYVRDITDYAVVKAYEFQRGNQRIWVLWSLDGNTHNLTLPGTPYAIYDFMGVSISPSNPLDVGLDPLYLEWNP